MCQRCIDRKAKFQPILESDMPVTLTGEEMMVMASTVTIVHTLVGAAISRETSAVLELTESLINLFHSHFNPHQVEALGQKFMRAMPPELAATMIHVPHVNLNESIEEQVVKASEIKTLEELYGTPKTTE